MARPPAKTTLYRLIEAGHLARQKLLVPVYEQGLEPGDDAVVFALTEPAGATETEIKEVTGLDSGALDMRLIRLEAAGILDRCAVGAQFEPGARLTARGRAAKETLEGRWRQLEEALTGALPAEERKTLRRTLKRFIRLLQR